MTFGTAQRSTMHAMGVTDAVYTPRWRVTGALVIAKGLDGRGQYCYGGDTLDWLNPEQAAHFTRLNLVERIDADAQDAIAVAARPPVPNGTPAEPLDLDDGEVSDAATPDSGAIDECVATLVRLQVPATAGGPTARTALRGNGFRYGNDVVAAAVKRRKSLSGTAADDDEEFAVVVM